MRTLVETALRFRVIVVVLALVLSFAGIEAARTAPQDVFPEFAPPRIEVQTEAPGLSTEEVEQIVTTPLEQALAGVPWVDEVRSKSVLGLSSVVLYLERGTDLIRARQLVAERVGLAAARLPVVARPPVILPPLSTTSRLMKIGVRSDTLSVMEQTDRVMWTIRPRLMSIPGVANVAVWGARQRQLQVQVDPDRLALAGLTVDDVARAAGEAVSTRTGGFVDTPNQRMAVHHVAAVRDADTLARAPLTTPDGRVIQLGDVTEVVEGWPPPIGDAVIDGGDGLLLIVEKQPWGNTLQVTHAVEAELEALAPALTDMVVDPTIFRPATFVERALDNLRRAMGIGVALVVLVLLLFEADLRAALISATAIPFSILTAVLVLTAMGTTFDTMVLAGLVIAVGEVVDDAIIDVENIGRRLRVRGDRPALEVVLEASLEVRSAVVYASLIVVLVFLPVFFLEGLSGAFFRPLAISYVTAIAASLLVALTVTPALCLWIMPRGASREASLLSAALVGLYRRVLPAFLARPLWVGAGLALALGGTGAAVPFLGESFLPDFQETDFLMHWVEKPGTSLSAMRRITEQAGRELMAVPGVRNFGAHIGRAEVADEVVGPNFTELWISIDEQADHAATVAAVQEVVDGYPGLYRDLLTYLKERVKEVLSGTSATMVVRVHGPDMAELQGIAARLRDTLAADPAVAKPRVEVRALVPQLQVALRPDAEGLGLSTAQVRDAVTPVLSGVTVGALLEADRVIDVSVIGTEALRGSLGTLPDLWIATPVGPRVRLGDVADVWIAPAADAIEHTGGSRKLDVLADAVDEDLGGAAAAVEAAVDALDLPPGYHAEVLGEAIERRDASQRLTWLALASLFAVFLVLHADFGSVRLAALVFATLPFALIGGVLAVVLTGGVASLGSVVGFVTVLGIAARNGILLVSHYRHLEGEGVDLEERVRRGGEERLAPILMTAASAGLALVPIVVAGPVAGHEIEYPMAVVILGGLVTSTALNLVVLPSLYLGLRRRWG